MQYCPNCGTKCPEGAVFCRECGISLKDIREKKAYDDRQSKEDINTSTIEIGSLTINVGELKDGAERVKVATADKIVKLKDTVSSYIEEQKDSKKEEQPPIKKQTDTTPIKSKQQRKIPEPKKKKHIGIYVAVGVVACICILIMVNRSKPQGESQGISSLVQKTGLVKCKEDGCEEVELFKDGYCKQHYYIKFGSEAIGDIISGEQTCKYADCDDTEVYEDGYCKKHYLELQAKSGINNILTGETSCKYTGCDSTDIYKDGFCKLHYSSGKVENVLQDLNILK